MTAFFSACQFTTSSSNREADKKEAQKVTDVFYADLTAGKTDSVYALFAPAFYQVTPKDSLTKIFNFLADKCGQIRSDSLADWETKVTRGTTNESDYLLKYRVVRAKHNSREEIRLLKEPVVLSR